MIRQVRGMSVSPLDRQRACHRVTYHRYVRVGIIGAGIIGCAIARELARDGRSVTVFDGRGVGGGATRASAGALVPYVEAHEDGPLQALTVRSLQLDDDFIRSVQGDSGADIDYRRCGSLEVARTVREQERLEAFARRMGRPGIEWLDAAETRRLEPTLSSDTRGSLRIDRHGYVSASQLTRALARAAVASGTEIHTLSAVSVHPTHAGADIIDAAGGQHAFDAVVVAAGAWASTIRVEGDRPPAIRPVKGELLQLRGLLLRGIVWSSSCYFVPQANGDVLLGATMQDVGFDERPTEAGRQQLWTAAATVVDMSTAVLIESRVGLRPAAADTLPFIGYAKTATTVIYAVGHFRNGIILAPLTAELVRKLLAHEPDPALALLSPSREKGTATFSDT